MCKTLKSNEVDVDVDVFSTPDKYVHKHILHTYT